MKTETATDENLNCKCPKCGEDIHVSMKYSIPQESRVIMRIEPQPEHKLKAETVSGSIENMGKLLVAVAKDSGIKINAFVEKIETDEHGALSIHFFCAQPSGKKHAA